MNLGLYIHFPFCKRKCDYCNFYSIPLYNDNEISKYITIICQELELRSSELRNFEVDTIYFGGGTPSLMRPSELGTVIEKICKHYNTTDRPELTVECNPDNFSTDRINQYKSLGVNRVVLGVQTTDAKLHSVIGRSAAPCNMTKLSDFSSIQGIERCVDLIIGIPGQTEKKLEHEIKQIIGCGFEHISAYTLSIESGTPLADRLGHRADCNSQDYNELQRVMLEMTMNLLSGAGYQHYEVSNYAMQGHQSKHNMKYWKFLPYAGFGPAAHSFYKGERYYNPGSLNEYLKNSGNIRQKDKRTKESEIVEYILSGMRLSSGISLNDFENKLNIKVPDKLMAVCREMSTEGLVKFFEDGDDLIISFTYEGFFQMDGLIYRLTELFL